MGHECLEFNGDGSAKEGVCAVGILKWTVTVATSFNGQVRNGLDQEYANRRPAVTSIQETWNVTHKYSCLSTFLGSWFVMPPSEINTHHHQHSPESRTSAGPKAGPQAKKHPQGVLETERFGVLLIVRRQHDPINESCNLTRFRRRVSLSLESCCGIIVGNTFGEKGRSVEIMAMFQTMLLVTEQVSS